MFKTLEISARIRVELSNNCLARVIAKTKFETNEVIYKAENYLVVLKSNYQSVQTGDNLHIIDSVLAHMNHSCDPNAFIDCNLLQVIAKKDISSNEEITFFYPSTEWEMSRPFSCYCNSQHCIKYIQGASKISDKILERYKLNKHIENKKIRLF